MIFEDDDIVILTLNGLLFEFNIIRSIIQGMDNVISIKNLMALLLAEEAMIDNVHAPTNFQTTMVDGASGGNPKDLLILGLNLKDFLGTLTIIKGTILHTSLYLTRIEAGASFYGSRFGNKPFYNNAASGILGTSPPRPQLYTVHQCHYVRFVVSMVILQIHGDSGMLMHL